jgi:hypothetical protein
LVGGKSVTVYWLLFFVPALAVLMRSRTLVDTPAPHDNFSVWAITWFLLTLLIGYRHEVGGDWGNYLYQYEQMRWQAFFILVQDGDPLHRVANWISGYFDWGVYGVNLMYGSIFSAGLIAFCRAQPNPQLALLVAIPYLVIVVAMGYSRQGVAIGLAMFALLALEERNNMKFVLYIFLAAGFHKTAVVLVPIAILASSQRRIWTAVWVGVAGMLMYSLYLADSTTTLYENYIEAEYASEGGAIRVAMTAMPAVFFLWLRNRFRLNDHEKRMWTWIALMALGLVVAFYLSPSSTAVDRIALYFIPIQIFALAHLPDALGGKHYHGLVTGAVVLYLAAVEFVWLNYAVHAQYWLPYQFYPLVGW